MTEPRQFVAGIAAIPHKNELSLGNQWISVASNCRRQVDGRFVPPAFDWFNSAGRYNATTPAMPHGRDANGNFTLIASTTTCDPDPDHVAVCRAAGIVMTPLAVNVFAFVLRRGVVGRTHHRFVGGNHFQDHRCQNLASSRQDQARQLNTR